jgi:hypothetical protein
MLTLPSSVRIFAAVEPVDARKSFDGLSAVVRDSLGGDPVVSGKPSPKFSHKFATIGSLDQQL